MNWYHSAKAVDELAAQYVLGTLKGPARRRFVAVMAQRADVAARVQDWEGQLHRLAQRLPELKPRPALWERMAMEAGLPANASAPSPGLQPATATSAQVGASTIASPATDAAVSAPLARSALSAPSAPLTASAPSAPSTPARRPAPAPAPSPGFVQRLGQLFQQLLSPVPAGALAFGLMAGLGLPLVLQVLNPPAVTGQEGGDSVPASYIGVLATPEGKQGLIVASLRHGRTVDLKQVSPMQPPAGQTLFLWTLDAQGQARPVGPIPAGAFVQAPLSDTAEKVFAQAVELGVTLEAVGSQPGTPGGPWVYRGLCGKVWRAPPPGQAAK